MYVHRILFLLFHYVLKRAAAGGRVAGRERGRRGKKELPRFWLPKSASQAHWREILRVLDTHSKG